jgi:hypothetical protein
VSRLGAVVTRLRAWLRRVDRAINAPAPGHGVGELVRLSCLAIAAPTLVLAVETLLADPWVFNDYYVYWLAGRVVAGGGNPYDVALLAQLAADDGHMFRLAGPYSYPPPFAIVMIPFSALPFEASAWIFSLVSLTVFGLAIGLLLTQAPVPARVSGGARAWAARAAGAYPPVSGSLVMGQANLLVFALLAAGFCLLSTGCVPAHPARQRLAGCVFGLTALVKLVPLALVVPLLLARRWSAASTLVGSALALLAATLLAAPVAARGMSGLAGLLEPDSYWTNQSVNGFVSRLLSDSDRTRALAPDIVPIGPAVAASTFILALLTAVVLWRSRACLHTPVGLLLGLVLALVAASAGAPKNSIWNHTPALLAVWVVLVQCGLTCSQRVSSPERMLVAFWYIGAFAHQVTGRLPLVLDQPWAGLSVLLVSSAFFGLLALWLLVARRLETLRASSAPRMERDVRGRCAGSASRPHWWAPARSGFLHRAAGPRTAQLQGAIATQFSNAVR